SASRAVVSNSSGCAMPSSHRMTSTTGYSRRSASSRATCRRGPSGSSTSLGSSASAVLVSGRPKQAAAAGALPPPLPNPLLEHAAGEADVPADAQAGELAGADGFVDPARPYG